MDWLIIDDYQWFVIMVMIMFDVDNDNGHLTIDIGWVIRGQEWNDDHLWCWAIQSAVKPVNDWWVVRVNG